MVLAVGGLLDGEGPGIGGKGFFIPPELVVNVANVVQRLADPWIVLSVGGLFDGQGADMGGKRVLIRLDVGK